MRPALRPEPPTLPLRRSRPGRRPLRDLPETPDAPVVPPPVRRHGWVLRVLVGAGLFAILLVGGTAFRVWQVARVDDRQSVDAVVVLGAAQYDGTPSSIFAARLKHAEALYEDGIAPRIITTGGGRSGDVTTEAEAGRRYLIDRGVPARDVIAVPEGSDTLGSLQAVALRAERDGWHSALVVSDPWHSLRARTMARDAGLTAWTSPTRSGPVVQTRETQARYIVRETAALLFYRLTHASVDTETSGLG
jgi:uncharacterized SAM-binding protein YcdF (DUF218 family)